MTKRGFAAVAFMAASLGAVAPAQALSISISTAPPLPVDATQSVLQNFDTPLTGDVTESQAPGALNVNTPGVANLMNTPFVIPGVGRRPGVTGNGPSDSFQAGNPYAGLSDGNFLSIASGESYTLTFSAPLRVISFALGSFNPSYQVTLNLESGPVQLTGAAIYGLVENFPDGTPVGFPVPNGNAYVRYDMGDAPGQGITGITFAQLGTGLFMEIDNIAGAAPEPAAWAMLIGGFGMAGFALRNRRKALTA